MKLVKRDWKNNNQADFRTFMMEETLADTMTLRGAEFNTWVKK